MNIFHIRDKNVFVNIDTIKGVAKLDNLRKEKYTKIYFLFDIVLFLLCVILQDRGNGCRAFRAKGAELNRQFTVISKKIMLCWLHWLNWFYWLLPTLAINVYNKCN